MTRATPRDHSPPIPIEAISRNAATCQAAWDSPQTPLNSAYVRMLRVMARTRPSRSPSQPNSTPPVAAPTRKPAVMTAFHRPSSTSPGLPSRSRTAGRATNGNSPISSPSNIHPKRAAASVIQRPRADRGDGAGGVMRKGAVRGLLPGYCPVSGGGTRNRGNPPDGLPPDPRVRTKGQNPQKKPQVRGPAEPHTTPQVLTAVRLGGRR